MDATLEALNEVNRSLVLHRREPERNAPRLEVLRSESAELKDIRAHWLQWRESWEKRLHRNEAHFLRSVADLNAAFEQRANTADLNYREHLESQHNDYLGALDTFNQEIQQRLWADLEAIRIEYERLIHYELRLIRQQRALAGSAQSPSQQRRHGEPRRLHLVRLSRSSQTGSAARKIRAQRSTILRSVL